MACELRALILLVVMFKVNFLQVYKSAKNMH